MALQLSNASAIIACNALVDNIDAGTTETLVIYSGTKPTDCDTALSGNTVLATFTLPDPAFGNAADVNPGARATANAITNVTASASGTASFFRIFKDSTAVFQGTVSAVGGGGDCEISTTTVTSGVTLSVTSMTATMPES